MKRMLTYRYVLALLAVVAVLIASFALVQGEINKNALDGHIINTSGRQRMLSQRVALLAREVQLGRAEQSALADAAEQMQRAHLALLQYHWPDGGDMHATPEIERMYLGRGGLDAQVSGYLQVVDVLIKGVQRDGAGSPAAIEAADQVATLSQSGLLEALDQVVHQYERESVAKTASFRQLEVLILIAGLLVLLVEALFLFRPMVHLVDTTLSTLERANEELRQFAYRISHDLRAPIASSIGLVRVALSSIENGKPEQAKRALTLMESSMTRLDALVSDVVTFTRSRSEAEPDQAMSMDELIASILANLGHMRGFDAVDVQVRCSVERPVMTKAMLLRQTLENLISNAIKYQDKDEDNPWVSIDVQLANDRCELSVSDNGIGVPQEHRSELFGMFRRFHPKVATGSGLGLYLVQQNAEGLGGSISYQARDKGSTFTLNFPG